MRNGGFRGEFDEKSKVLIKDIARIVGVSSATVSFVINGKGPEKNISKGTISRIIRVVSKLNYQPDPFAQNLRKGRSRIIGFLVNDISLPFFSDVAMVLERKMADRGYSILISSFGKEGTNFQNAVKILKSRCVDGYIIAAIPCLEAPIQRLISLRKPVVIFDQNFPGLEANYVLTDNFNAVYDATLYLLAQGFSKIGFITAENSELQLMDRLDGYTAATKNRNIRTTVVQLRDKTPSVTQLHDFASSVDDLDALIFASGRLTKMGLEIASKNKMDIFKEKGIISFDDFDILRYLSPPVTAISQSIEEIGERIMKILEKELNRDGTGRGFSTVRVATSLVIRESTILPQDRGGICGKSNG